MPRMPLFTDGDWGLSRRQNGSSSRASLLFRPSLLQTPLLLASLLALFLAGGCDSGGSGPEGSEPEPPSTPSAPSGLQAQPDGDAITLEWSAPSGSDVQYNVYRSTGPIESVADREPINDSPVGQPSFTDQEARAWEPYRYRVTALRASSGETAEGDPSGEVRVTLPETEYVAQAPDPQGPIGFGTPINPAGDLVGNGATDLLVGTFTFSDFSNSRRVYLFDGAAGTVEEAIRPGGLASGEPFGFLGRGVEDVDGDGTGDLLIGSRGASVGEAEEAGRTHLLSGADRSVLWSRESPDPQAEGQFGFGDAVGDVNGDGTPDLAVAAPGESADGLEEAGRIYLLDGTDSAVLDTLVSPDPQQGASFGFLKQIGDVDGDGEPDLFVRTPRRDVDGLEDAGRVYLFDGAALRAEQRLETIRILESPNPEGGGFFSFRAVVSLGAGGDETSRLLVGAPGETVDGKSVAGRAYLFDVADGTLLETYTSPAPEEETGFGNAIRFAGDVNGDGREDLAIRALESVGGLEEAGRIYLFDGSDGSVLRQFVSPNLEEQGFLGTDFEILPEEDVLIAGANGESSGGVEDAGRIYGFPLP